LYLLIVILAKIKKSKHMLYRLKVWSQ